MADAESSTGKAEHDSSKQEFYVEIKTDADTKARAVLQYDWLSKDHVDLYHTEVPPVFRGKGIGKILAEAALDHFIEKKIKMSPTCTFIQKYVHDNPNPDITDLIVK